MISLILGILLMAFAAFAVIPSFPLNWAQEVLQFLKGAAPCLAAFIGIVCLFIGIADIKDKIEAKKEENESNKTE